MAGPQTPPILANIRAARTYSEQAASLVALKNEVTGHIQKKEKWVEQGVLDHVVQLLQTARSTQSHNGKDFREGASIGLSEQEQVRLQALQLLSVFANGKTCILYGRLEQLG